MTRGQANLQVRDERTLSERKVEERLAFRFQSTRVAKRDVTCNPCADDVQIRLEMVAAASLTADEAADDCRRLEMHERNNEIGNWI